MAGKKSRKKSGGLSWFLMLFGAPFFCVGVGMFYTSTAMLARWLEADTWLAAEATIRSVNLEHHTDSEGSTSHKVVCEYEYTDQGETYINDRVGLAGGSDSIGSWQRRTHERLKQHFDSNEPVTCYVNPSDPADAILDRSLRVELFLFYWVFVITFGGAGAGCIIGGWVLRRSLKRRAELREQFPDQPWAWNPQWREGVLRTKTGAKAAMMWGFAIFWNALGGWPVIFIPGELRDGNYLMLLVLLFPLVGVLLLWGAIHATLQWRRFGRSTFAMDTMPGVIGGHLRGTLSIVGKLSAMDGIDVSLRCVHKWTTQSGDSSTTHTETLYEDKRNYPVSQRFGDVEVRLPIDFQVPYDCKPTEERDSGDSIEWQLKAEADLPGTDLSLGFEVPVFRTDESDPNVGRSEESLAAERELVESEQAPQPRKVAISRDTRGNECIECSAWPGAGLAVGLTIATLVMLGVAGFSIYRLLRGDCFFTIFLLGFGLVGLVMLAVVLSFVGRWRVSFDVDEVSVERAHLFGRSVKQIPRDRIERIEYQRSGSANDVSYYAMHLVEAGGGKTKIAGSLRGKQMARWLAHQVETRLGLEDAVRMVESTSSRLRAERKRRKGQ